MNGLDIPFGEAVRGLRAGDFSHLARLFREHPDGSPPAVVKWHQARLFEEHPGTMEEAFTCACFLGAINVVEYFLAQGLAPGGGSATGLNAIHWAVNRGHIDVVRMLLEGGAPLESRSIFGSTVLGTAVWSALNEPRADHLRIIDILIRAGADIRQVPHPTGSALIDDLIWNAGASE